MNTLSRNDSCPCGSGKKYKKCCLDKAAKPGVNRQMAGQALQIALQHHKAGNLRQAEAIYRSILQTNPDQPDALHLLGNIAYQAGNYDAAAGIIERAISIKSGNPAFHISLGSAYQALGRLDKATSSYRKALALNPDYFDAHYNLGIVLHKQGKLDVAADNYRKAITLNPDFAEAHNNLGNVLREQQKLNEAITCYQEALTLNPGFAGAHNNLGNVFKDQDNLSEAAAHYQQALAIDPAYAEAHYNLGIVFQLQGNPDEAIKRFQQALLLNPDYIEAYNNLGNTLKDQGRLNEAITCFKHVLILKPDFAEAHYNLGNTLKEQDLSEATACYRQALMHKPDYAEAHYNLGHALQKQGRVDEAIESYRKALEITPDTDTHSNLLLTMQYSPELTPPEIFAEHLRFARFFEAPLKPYWPAYANTRDPKKRLRIGYVSGDFRRHPVANFIEPILANHDKSQIEVFCYYNHGLHDDKTAQIIAVADHWIPCSRLTNEQLAERIRSDGIDILVDLSGHTAYNRLLVFAQKPAPVQATWIGYPGTTGLSGMDYRLTDNHLDPEGMTEQYHTETLLRLTSSFTFQASAESPPVNSLPALSSPHFTLACLNNLAKINQGAVHLWARILTALPQSRLMLGNASDEAQQRLAGMFAREGVAAERLVFHPTMPLRDYLALHHRIDLALDPFPYTGGTSTCHSLWMGVPVITLAGCTPASRQGVAVMEWAGATEFVASLKDEYVKRVLDLAHDLPALARTRQALRERMAARQDADPVGLTRNLEERYRSIWEKWCNV